MIDLPLSREEGMATRAATWTETEEGTKWTNNSSSLVPLETPAIPASMNVGSLLLWLLLLPVEASCCSSLGRGCGGCCGGCSRRNRVSYSTSQKWNVGGHQPRSCWRWWTAVRPCLTAVVKVCIWYIWGHDKTINIQHNGTPNTFCISSIKPTLTALL